MFLLALTTWMTFAAPVWPRLLHLIPAPTCARFLTSTAPTSADEVMSLLRLTDPRVRRYLELHTHQNDSPTRDFGDDFRALALIYGDQTNFDLRDETGESPFATWDRHFRYWIFSSANQRRQMAQAFVRTLVQSDWLVRPGDGLGTVYVDRFTVEHAFRTTKMIFDLISIARHWDVDDHEHASLRLHQLIPALRDQLRADASLREDVIARLSNRRGPDALVNVTKPVRQLARAYREFVALQPDPIKQLVEDVRRRMATRPILRR